MMLAESFPFHEVEIPFLKGEVAATFFFPFSSSSSFLPSADLCEFVVFHGCEFDECDLGV